MVAFAAGEIDAAQAMIYNEYAQVLEMKNPATDELYTAEDLNVISWEEYGTSMLQDAIFASEAWLAQAGNEDDAVKFLKASFRGWIFCRDNPEECVDIVLKSDAALPKGHQTWQLNEVNGIIWPAPNGIGITDEAAFDRTVEVASVGKILTKPVEGTAWRNDLAEKALAELDGRGHQGRVVDEGDRHPHGGWPVAAPPGSMREIEAGRHRRPASRLPGAATRVAILIACLARRWLRAAGSSSPTTSDATSASASALAPVPTPVPSDAPTLTPVRLLVRWTMGAAFAGYIAAIDQGYYEAAGIDVTIVEGGPDVFPEVVGSESVGPRVHDQPGCRSVLKARDSAARPISSTSARSSSRSATVSMSSGTMPRSRDPPTCRDTGWASSASGNEFEVTAAAMAAGLRPEQDFTPRRAGRRDARVPATARSTSPRRRSTTTTRRSWRRQIRRTHAPYRPTDLNVINYNDEGTAMLQDAIFARASWLDQDGNEELASPIPEGVVPGLDALPRRSGGLRRGGREGWRDRGARRVGEPERIGAGRFTCDVSGGARCQPSGVEVAGRPRGMGDERGQPADLAGTRGDRRAGPGRMAAHGRCLPRGRRHRGAAAGRCVPHGPRAGSAGDARRPRHDGRGVREGHGRDHAAGEAP